MRFSENRLLAWGVLVVAVLLSLALSGGGALRDLRFDTQNVFYQGATGDGLCIDRDLDARAEAAYNILSIAKGYIDDAGLLSEAEEARAAVADTESISARYQANAKLNQLIEDVYTQLDNASLSETDKSFAYNQYKEFVSRGDTIGRDVYNDRASAFNHTIGVFPTALVARLGGIENLELFA